ncbi:hypothetical protein GOBAR_DD04340 [Gossypium barbadense]|nr:hypothetical protein GOBAR_DD04340 [Gossypium barbadense]
MDSRNFLKFESHSSDSQSRDWVLHGSRKNQGRRVYSRLYQSGRLDWGSGKISTNSSLQETSLGLVMSPAALLGSPDRIIGLQDALRGLLHSYSREAIQIVLESSPGIEIRSLTSDDLIFFAEASLHSALGISNSERRFYGCSDFLDGGCDFFKWYDGQMCDCTIELLRQLRDSKLNLLKDNLALRNKVMDLDAFDGSHNGGNSAVDTELEGGFFVGNSGKRHMQLAVRNVG